MVTMGPVFINRWFFYNLNIVQGFSGDRNNCHNENVAAFNNDHYRYVSLAHYYDIPPPPFNPWYCVYYMTFSPLLPDL